MSIAHLLDRDDVTVEEFLEFDEENEYARYELIDGRVYILPRGRMANYCTVSGNLLALIDDHLRGDYSQEVLSNFKAYGNGNFYHADLIVNGNPAITDTYFIRKPKLIIQGLSDTRDHAFMKFSHYERIASLEEHATFEPDDMEVIVYRKSDDWNGTRYKKGNNVEFQSIGLTVPMEEIYERVVFFRDELPHKITLVRNTKAD